MEISNADASYYRCVKRWMLPFIQDGPNAILDLGCAEGLLGGLLQERGKAAVVDGVEIFPPVAMEAAKRYRRVHVGDIEAMSLEYGEEFDYVICGDILEHLKDPYSMVTRIRGWLKPGGMLLVCLPNIRNYRVLADLILHGEWRYVSAGILDRTHLRFFTRKSCQRMLEEGGFEVTHQHMIITGPKKTACSKLALGLLDEFLAPQVFFCGKKK